MWVKRAKSDRRRPLRYALKHEVFVAFGPVFGKVGKLKDVSSGGVAFEYTVFDRQTIVADSEVDIFANKPDHFLLRQVPCKVVYDVKVASPSAVDVDTRRCGVKFIKLSKQHKDQLMLLIRNCASHPLPTEYPGTKPEAFSDSL
jgi:hypothetical protein